MAANDFDYKQYIMLAKRNKRLWVISALAIMTIVTIVSYLLPNKYEAKSTVFIEKSVIADLVKGLAVTPSIEDKIKALTYAISSRTLILKVLDELDLNLKKTGGAELEALDQVNAEQEPRSRSGTRKGFLLSRSRTVIPNWRAIMSTHWCDAILRKAPPVNGKTPTAPPHFITEQAAAFKEKLQKSEDAVNAFKQGEGSIATMDPTAFAQGYQ